MREIKFGINLHRKNIFEPFRCEVCGEKISGSDIVYVEEMIVCKNHVEEAEKILYEENINLLK